MSQAALTYAPVVGFAKFSLFEPDLTRFILFHAINPGAAGNLISVELIVSLDPDLPLLVTVVGTAITIQAATDGVGNTVSTYTDVYNTLIANVDVTALVYVLLDPLDPNILVLNHPQSFLQGGLDASDDIEFFLFDAAPPAPPLPSNVPISLPGFGSGGQVLGAWAGGSVVLPDPKQPICESEFLKQQKCLGRNFIVGKATVIGRC